MSETENSSHNETYDPTKILKELQRIESSPKLSAGFRQAAIGRAKDIYYSGELGNFIHPNDKVFYLGTGSGHVAQLIEQQTQAKVFKLDLYDLRSVDTKDNKFIIATARFLPIQDQSLDVVALMDVLHHCNNQEEILREALRVLRPGGKVLVLEDTLPEQKHPNQRKIMKFLISKEDDLANRQPTNTNPHNYRSINEWKQLFGEVGFDAQIDTKFWYWGLWDFMPTQIRPPRTDHPTLTRPFESTRFVVTKVSNSS